jgi:hypothetical protein
MRILVAYGKTSPWKGKVGGRCRAKIVSGFPHLRYGYNPITKRTPVIVFSLARSAENKVCQALKEIYVSTFGTKINPSPRNLSVPEK